MGARQACGIARVNLTYSSLYFSIRPYNQRKGTAYSDAISSRDCANFLWHGIRLPHPGQPFTSSNSPTADMAHQIPLQHIHMLLDESLSPDLSGVELTAIAESRGSVGFRRFERILRSRKTYSPLALSHDDASGFPEQGGSKLPTATVMISHRSSGCFHSSTRSVRHLAVPKLS